MGMQRRVSTCPRKPPCSDGSRPECDLSVCLMAWGELTEQSYPALRSSVYVHPAGTSPWDPPCRDRPLPPGSTSGRPCSASHRSPSLGAMTSPLPAATPDTPPSAAGRAGGDGRSAQTGGDDPSHRVDLVLEGGGTEGIALAGALDVLEERGYRVHRAPGPSAGARAAALAAAGIPAHEGGGSLRPNGVHRGAHLTRRVQAQRAAHPPLGADATFGDLVLEDPERDSDLADPRHHRLVVTASDLSAGRLRLLPRDADDYGIDPSALRVADAVRVSSSIPLFFRPVRWRLPAGGSAVLVDGGLLSNFPVSVFDRPDGEVPRWPTFGIKLSATPEADFGRRNRIRGALSFGKAIVDTVTGFYDRMHIDAQHTVERTIFIDTDAVRPTQF